MSGAWAGNHHELVGFWTRIGFTIQGVAEIAIADHQTSVILQEKENIVVRFQQEQRSFDFVEVQSVNSCVCICRPALEDGPFPFSVEVSEESSSHFECRRMGSLRIMIER